MRRFWVDWSRVKLRIIGRHYIAKARHRGYIECMWHVHNTRIEIWIGPEFALGFGIAFKPIRWFWIRLSFLCVNIGERLGCARQ